MLVVVFRAAPGAVDALVPQPLTPNPDDLAFLMVGGLRSDALGVINEAFLAVPSRHGDRTGSFAVALYLDNDAATAAGREVWGWRKKATRVAIEHTGERFGATVERARAAIVRAGLEGAASVDPSALPLDPTWFNLKLIPSAALDGPPDVLQVTATTRQDVRVRDVQAGPATIAFADGPSDPLGQILPVCEMLGGFLFGLDFDLPLGEVLHDFLAPALAAAT